MMAVYLTRQTSTFLWLQYPNSLNYGQSKWHLSEQMPSWKNIGPNTQHSLTQTCGVSLQYGQTWQGKSISSCMNVIIACWITKTAMTLGNIETHWRNREWRAVLKLQIHHSGQQEPSSVSDTISIIPVSANEKNVIVLSFDVWRN